MEYFSDIRFIQCRRDADCRVHIDRELPGLAINHLISGSIYFEVDGGKRKILNAPSLYWTWEGVKFRYGPLPGVRWNHCYAHAIGPGCDRMVAEGVFPPSNSPVVNAVNDPSILDDTLNIIRLFKESYPMTRDECAWLLLGIGVKASRLRESEDDGTRPKTHSEIRMLANRIRNAPDKCWDFHKLAKKAGYSYSHFRKLFRDETGRAPLDYALHCRMLLAADLLRRERRVKPVAAALGFDNPFHFSKLFKSKMGLSPKKFIATSLSPGDNEDAP